MYDKPKVTIDLDEYLELKRDVAAKAALNFMELGQVVLLNIGHGLGRPIRAQVTNREFSDAGSVTYFLTSDQGPVQLYFPKENP